MSISSGEKTRKPLKIAILSPSAPPVSTGGIATSHTALYRGLKRRGFAVELLTFADFGGARFHRDAEAGVLRYGSSIIGVKVVQAMSKLRFALAEGSIRYRIYQTGDVWKSRAGARRINARLRASRPDILIFPDQASPAVWLDKLPGQRWIQVSHHQAFRFVNQPEIGLHSLRDAIAATKLERAQLGRSDACVAPTNYMAGVVRSFVSAEVPITVISNLVDDVPETAKREAGVARVFIPSGGSLFKGSEVVPALIAGIRKHFSAEVEFFISGTLSDAQKARIERDSPGVHLSAPGHLSHAETLTNLAQARVCVSPTWIENQSMALLEAKALGIPFVAFDVGGNREQLGPEDRLVPRGDVDALVRATSEILGNPTPIGNFDYRAQNERALDQWASLFNAAEK